MRAQAFYKLVTMDEADLYGRLFELLTEHNIAYCLIGGQAVNAYVEPLISLDLDVVVATDQIEKAADLLGHEFTIKRFPHRLSISSAQSGLRVQIQIDPRYASFPSRAEARDVLGVHLCVASLDDVLQGKIWAAQDPTRRGSKFQKDLLTSRD